ncbi:putative toxin-antitoxin system toxin component, PIN family [Patescibacteria group bacterium]|nr:putative toxin-antitoxin system toxin component, PIN family [Patescibacteria group bacterium]
MIKVVPDTNIMLSGMLGFPGYPRKILNLSLAKKIVLYGSEETFAEFKEKILVKRVQKYWKKQIYTPEKLVLDYRSLIKIVEPYEVLEGVSITRDKDDDIWFRVAKACGAQIIISGDKDVLDIKNYDGIRAVTGKRFIDSLEKLNLGKIY